MAQEPSQPESTTPASGASEPPKIRIKGPGEKGERPEIKIRKVADSDQQPPAPPENPDTQAGEPKTPVEKKKATVRINLPGAAPAAPAGAAPVEKKQIRVRVDQGAVTQKPAAPPAGAGDLPQSVRIRGPKGESQQIDLAPSSQSQASPGTGQKADKASAPAGKPRGSDAAPAAAGEVKPPQGKTSARLLKHQSAAGVSQERAPSYAGGISVKRKSKDAGPVVSTFSALAAVVGLAVVYLLLAQALPDLSLPVPRLF